MCNLYSITRAPDAVRRWFQIELPLATNLEPLTQVWPTDRAPIVRRSGENGRELALASWSLVPPHVSDLKAFRRAYATFNARAEGLARSPLYRGPLRARRCLVPADAFYEHPVVGGRKQRHEVRLKDGGLMGLAGLWERNDQVSEPPLETFTMITVEANELVRPLHPKGRMPAVLRPEDYAAWLDPQTPAEEALSMLRTWPADEMEAAALASAGQVGVAPLRRGEPSDPRCQIFGNSRSLG